MTHQREFGWIRQVRRGTLVAEIFRTNEEKREVVNGMEALGFEKVQAPALYDNGDFIVVDSVKDLSFSVIHVMEGGHLVRMREVPLDRYEAIRIADEFKEALSGDLSDQDLADRKTFLGFEGESDRSIFSAQHGVGNFG